MWYWFWDKVVRRIWKDFEEIVSKSLKQFKKVVNKGLEKSEDDVFRSWRKVD